MKKILSILLFAVLSAAPIFANGGIVEGNDLPDISQIKPKKPTTNSISGLRIQVTVGGWETGHFIGDWLPFFALDWNKSFATSLVVSFQNLNTGEEHSVTLAPGTTHYWPQMRPSPTTLNSNTSHLGTWKITARAGSSVGTGYVTIVTDYDSVSTIMK